MDNKKRTIFTVCLGVISLLALACAILVKHHFSSEPWDGTVYLLADVKLGIDRALAHPYNDCIHMAGNALVLLNIFFIPAVFIFYKTFTSENKIKTFIFMCIIFIITFCCTKACYDLLKVFVHRIRPYMYFENPSAKGVMEGDFNHSWPSGHTTNAFMGAGFITAMVLLLKEKSVLGKTLIVVTYVVAISTAVVRILSGNHFPTDVLSGAVLGSITGWGISFLIAKFGIRVKDDMLIG